MYNNKIGQFEYDKYEICSYINKGTSNTTCVYKKSNPKNELIGTLMWEDIANGHPFNENTTPELRQVVEEIDLLERIKGYPSFKARYPMSSNPADDGNGEHEDGKEHTGPYSEPSSSSSAFLSCPWSLLDKNEPGSGLMTPEARSKMKQNALNRGIEGERKTAGAIHAFISKNHGYLLNSVKVIDVRDIDHVLICDRGVFIINSKNYSDKIIVDGNTVTAKDYESHDWVDSILGDVALVKSRLMEYGYKDVIQKLPVFPVFSVVNGATIFNQAEADFIDTSALAFFIESKEPVLQDDLVDYLFSDMRRSTFWRAA